MDEISDIWFSSQKYTLDISKNLGVENAHHNYENYWEWTEGLFQGTEINISKAIENENDVRIFLSGMKPFNEEIQNMLISKLLALNISPIYLGKWIYITGNDFEKKIVSTIEKPDGRG